MGFVVVCLKGKSSLFCCSKEPKQKIIFYLNLFTYLVDDHFIFLTNYTNLKSIGPLHLA